MSDLLSVSLGTLAVINQVHSNQITECCTQILMRLMENEKFHEVLSMVDASLLVQMFVPLLQLKVCCRLSFGVGESELLGKGLFTNNGGQGQTTGNRQFYCSEAQVVILRESSFVKELV